MVGKTVCADAFAGVVRREDVRGWEVDRVVLGEGFRVGDVVRGVVVSGLVFFYAVCGVGGGWDGDVDEEASAAVWGYSVGDAGF